MKDLNIRCPTSGCEYQCTLRIYDGVDEGRAKKEAAFSLRRHQNQRHGAKHELTTQALDAIDASAVEVK